MNLVVCFRNLVSHFIKLGNDIINDPYFESREIIRYVKGYSLEEFFLYFSTAQLSHQEQILVNSMAKRRLLGEPLAYILNHKEFFSKDFYVNHDVLIPRCDTEVLVEAVLNNHSKQDNLKILDLGTGSGCIIIALLSAMPSCFGVAIDISDKALKVCARNAYNHGVTERLSIKKSNWLEQLENTKFDIIVSNPPYIASNEHHLMSRGTKFEPAISLYSKDNGLCSYLTIAREVGKFMRDNSNLYAEIGINKSAEVIGIFDKFGIKCVQSYKDSADITRCLQFKISR